MIFYFSGTGNSQWAAKIMASSDERVVFMSPETAEETYTLDEGERLGFCYPVHGWQPPRYVRKFIEKLKITNTEGHYCYLLLTCGDNIGMTMEISRKMFNEIGIHISRTFQIQMPESYVALPGMDVDTEANECKKIDDAFDLLGEYKRALNSKIEGNDLILDKGKCPWLLSHVVGAFFNRFMITDRPFIVDNNLCKRCGKCQKACPVNNVGKNEDGTPRWKHNGKCVTCLSCYHHCPFHAINYGVFTKKHGQYYLGRNTNIVV